MTLHLGKVRPLAPALVTSLVLSLVLALAVLVSPPGTAPARAAAPLTVSQAIAQQTGASQTVRGYVVGQPTATSTVVRSGFPNDYALAIADSASQTNTSSMLYVQIPSAFRAQWGLKTNPSLMGKQIDVTGALSAYFSHPGMTSTSAFALAGGGTPTDPPPTGGTSPWDSTYYAPAIGKTGAALRTSLHDIIDNNTKLSYDAVWTALKDTDQDPNNNSNVIELYTGRSIAKSNNGGGTGQWNREHVFAQSRGSKESESVHQSVQPDTAVPPLSKSLLPRVPLTVTSSARRWCRSVPGPALVVKPPRDWAKTCSRFHCPALPPKLFFEIERPV